MPSQVDERVVRMQFDNAQFERKMASTMSSLQKFEEQLKFEGADKGLQTIQKAADKIDMSNLENAADSIEVKFSVMSTAVVHQVNRMVDAVVDASVKMAKSLTFDQITSGFDKYTEKTAAVQTIMNATGKSVEDVGNALEKLQWFSDETSYSFVDMTSNVGKFTSAGVDLDVAVSAMQGIANAAADAGANSTEASRAMYNFSQALSRGYVQLIDWKSIENANMATITFKDTIVQTALELGTLTKAADGTLQTLKGNAVSATNFNEALSDAWLTNDVLLKSLSKYSAYSDAIYEVSDAFDTCADAMAATSEEGMELGARAFKAAQQAKTFREAVDATKDAVSSGWMRTFEIIFGNFNESVELWTAFTNTLWDVFASGAEGRNEVLKGGLMSGWNKLVEEGITDTEKLKSTIIDLGTASDENLTKIIEDAGGFEKSLSSGWVTADILKDSINKIADEILTLDQAQLESKGYTQASIESFLALKKSIDDGTISLEDFAAEMSKPSGRENLISAVSNAFQGLKSIIEPIRNAIRDIFPPITAETIYNMTTFLKEFTSQLKLSSGAAYTLTVMVKVLLLPLKVVFTLVKVGVAWIATFAVVIFKLADAFLNLMSKTNILSAALKKIFGEDRYTRLAKAWSKITDKISKAFTSLGTAISDGFGWLVEHGGPKILSILNSIYEFFKPVIDIILDGVVSAFEVLANFSFSKMFDKIEKGFNYILDQFPLLRTGAEKILSLLKSFIGWFKDKTIMDAVDLIVNGFKNLKDLIVSTFVSIDWSGVWGSFVDWLKKASEAISPFISYLWNLIKALTPAKILTYSFGVVLISMLLNFSRVAKSVTGLFDSITGAIKGFTAQFQPTKYTAIAASILILTGALVVLASMDVDKLKSAVATLGGIAAGLLLFAVTLTGLSKWISKDKDSIKAFSDMMLLLVAISGSIVIVAAAMKMMSRIDSMDSVIKGLIITFTTFGVLIATITLLSKNSKNFEVSAKTIISIAAGLFLMVKALETISGFDQKQMLTAIFGLIACVSALSILFNQTSSIKEGQKKSFSGLFSLVSGLLLFIVALKAFANFDGTTYIQGLLKIVPILAILKLLSISIKDSGKEAANSNSALLGMSAMLLSMTLVIKALASISLGDVAKGVAAITAMTLLLTLVMKSMTTYDKDKEKVVKAGGTFIAMTAAIGLMSLAIWALGKIELSDLLKGTAVVATLIAIMTGLLKATKDAGKVTGTLFSLTLVIGALASTIALLSLMDASEAISATVTLYIALSGLSKVIKALGQTDWKKGITAATSMAVLIAEVTAALILLGKNDFKTNLSSAISLSAVLLATSVSVKLIGSIDWKDGLSKAKDMLAFIGITTAALLALGKWNDADAERTTANAIAISISVMAVAEAVKIIESTSSGIKNDKKFISSIVAAGAALVIVAIALGAIGAIGIDSKNIIAISLAISMAVLGVAEAIKIMAEAKIQDRKAARLEQSIGAAIGILVAAAISLGLIATKAPNANYKVVISSAAGISIAVIAVAEAVKTMSTIDIKDQTITDLGKMLGLAAGLMGEVGLVLLAMSELEVRDALPNATALSEVILALGVAVKLMDGIKIDKSIISMGVALLLVLAGLTAVFGIMGATDYHATNSDILALIGVLGTLTAMVAVFNKLDVSVSNTFKGAASIDIIIGMIVAIVAVIGAISYAIEQAGGFNIIDQGVDALKKLNDIIPLLVTFTVLSVVLSAIGSLFKSGSITGAAYGGAAFDIITVLFAGLITALGGLMQIDGFWDLVNDGAAAFEKLGEAIGGFLGNVVGQFMGNAFDAGLGTAIESIEDFAERIGPALDKISDDKVTSAVSAISGLIGAMALLTAADFLDSINIFTSEDPLTKLADQLEEGNFADSLVDFLNSLDDITVDDATVQKGINGAKAIAEIAASLPREDGYFQFLAGNVQPLTTFAQGVAEIGPSLKLFFDNITGISATQEEVDASINAFSALADIAGDLYRVGGIWQDLFGDVKSIDGFSKKLPTVAENLVDYCAIISADDAHFDADFVTNSANSIKALADVASGLYKVGGIWQDLFGDVKSIDGFSKKLPTVAENMVSYYTTLKDANFDEAFTTNSVNAVNALAAVANGLYREGSIFEIYTGKKVTLTELGIGIKDIGDALNSYYANTSGIDQSKTGGALSLVSSLNEIAKSLGTEDTVWEKIIKGETVSLSQFGSEINSLGAKLELFGIKIAGIDPTKLEASMKAINQFYNLFVNLGVLYEDTQKNVNFNDFLKSFTEIDMKAFQDAFNNVDITGAVTLMLNKFQSKLTESATVTRLNSIMVWFANTAVRYFTNQLATESVGKSIADGFIDAINNNTSEADLSELASKLVDAFGTKITYMTESLTSDVNEAFSEVIPTIRKAIGFDETGNTSDILDKLGYNLMNSLASGIDRYNLTMTIGSSFNKVLLAANNAFGISYQSSTKFEDIGKYIVLGLAKGIGDNTESGKKAIIKMSNTLLETAKVANAISSPSKVYRDEVGRWIVEGITEGLKDSDSAEDAARKLAQNIQNAFSESLNGLDLQDTKEDLEYQLWEALNPNATDVEKNMKKAEMLETQIDRQAERVSAANAEYKAMVQTFGETSTEAQEAYNRYLQAQIEMANIAGEISDLRSASLEDAQAAINEYYSYNNHDLDALLEAGYTVEEAWKMAAEDLGYDVKALDEARNKNKSVAEMFGSRLEKDVEVSLETPVGSLEDFISSLVEGTIANGVANGVLSQKDIEDLINDKSGLSVAAALAKVYGAKEEDIDLSDYTTGSFDFSSFEVEMPDIDSEVEKAVKQATDGIEEFLPGGLSKSIDDLISGAFEGLTKLGDLGSLSAKDFLKKFCEFLGIASPSTVMTEQGEYVTQGFANGVNNTSYIAENAMVDMARTAVTACAETLGMVTDNVVKSNSTYVGTTLAEAIRTASEMVMNSDISQPIIRPVLDMSEVQSGLRAFRLSSGLAFDIGGIDSQFRANKAAAANIQNGSPQMPVSNQTVYNFNQTNTSPKSLNASEIYRQSKNLFSQLKNK